MYQKPQILLINHSKETVEGLTDFLMKKYEVDTAFDGLDGLRQFEEKEMSFDLIITDLIMPQMSGIELISLIKQQSSHIPVIAITGWGKEPSELALEAKADIILQKPFDLVALDESISQLLPSDSSLIFLNNNSVR
jgi:DNA-binding response OmpR family regulator